MNVLEVQGAANKILSNLIERVSSYPLKKKTILFSSAIQEHTPSFAKLRT